jgi:nucleotide-binding universal stress UspA family protein
MLPIHRILQPVDFSDRSLRMTAYAKTLAAKYGAELTLLHGINPMYTLPPTAISGPIMIPIPASVIQEREQQLDQFVVEELRGVSVRRLVYEGDPAEQIVDFVKSEDVQIVVMATHGYGVLRRFLIGSVTAKVLHDVACPVLTGVHLNPHHDGSAQFSNILCAIDVEEHDQATLAWAAQFAADFGAQLNIVHAEVDDDRATQAAEEVKTMQEATGTTSASVHVQEGETVHTVCSLAETIGADLLVIGRGRREETGALTTTAYSIIRESPCPVVSV